MNPAGKSFLQSPCGKAQETVLASGREVAPGPCLPLIFLCAGFRCAARAAAGKASSGQELKRKPSRGPCSKPDRNLGCGEGLFLCTQPVFQR